jgi:hypothetical protein
MSTATSLSEGRYGRSGDQRADRNLKITGGVLGVVFLALLGWFGYHYIGGSDISGQVVAFRTSADSVRVHLEVHKDSGTHGYCTVRSLAEDHSEVGRADFRFDSSATSVDKVVTLRTTAPGTTAELLGCHSG